MEKKATVERKGDSVIFVIKKICFAACGFIYQNTRLCLFSARKLVNFAKI